MRRKLLNFAAAVSLLLCVASAGLWVRGYWTQDDVSGGIRFSSFWYGDISHRAGKWLASVFENPSIPAGKVEYHSGPLTPPEYLFVPRRQGSDDVYFSALGLTFLHQTDAVSDAFYYVGVPDWMPVLLLLLLPSLWLWGLLRRGYRAGLCVHCGYSLTGNTSGVCPECGTPVPKEPADKSPRPA